MSDIPRTRPSSDRLVEAGCIEHPSIVKVDAFVQSGIVEPLESFVPGLILVTVSLQKEGSMSAPPSRGHKIKRSNLLTHKPEGFKVGRPELDRTARVR